MNDESDLRPYLAEIRDLQYQAVRNLRRIVVLAMIVMVVNLLACAAILAELAFLGLAFTRA